MTGTFAVSRDRIELAMLPLLHHPAAPPRAPLAVAARAALVGTRLALRFTLRGDLENVALPAYATVPSRRDELWRHTCCEAFLGAPSRRSYVEANFAPSGDWALYAFDDRRRGMRSASVSCAPRVTQTHAAREALLDVALELDSLAAVLGEPPYALGLAAVVEQRDGRLAYFALAHPGAQPDFHDRDGWATSIAPAGPA